jgi:hypothetical protein
MGMLAVWALRFPQDPSDPAEAANPTFGFALVEHDFTPRPAYTALAANADLIQRHGPGAHTLDDLERAHLALGDPIKLHINGEGVDLVVQGPNANEVVVDINGIEGNTIAWDLTAGQTSQFAIVSGLADGPYDVEIYLQDATPEGDPEPVLGYIVRRDNVQLWIYPWLRAALLLALALLCASAGWLVWDVRRLRGRGRYVADTFSEEPTGVILESAVEHG